LVRGGAGARTLWEQHMNKHTQTYNLYYTPKFTLDNLILTLEKKFKYWP
jgi:hypothetical protein